jgi:hypothetical protein
MIRFFVHAKGARAEEWKRVFGNDALPVISGVPQRVELPGLGSRAASMVESELSTRGLLPIPVSDDLIGPALDLRFFV